MRILIRTSKWAIWSRRFSSIAVPLVVIPVFMHRERVISSADFFTIELVAMGMAALGLVLALGAYMRLWITGDQGWGKATTGLFLGALCLSPLLVIGFAMVRYPAVGDVTTDTGSPPGLVSQVPPGGRRATPDEVRESFPNARSRSYPIAAQQLFALVAQLAEERQWEPRARREPQTPLAAGQLNAIAMTLLGWRDEVAIRIEGTPEGALVDMRSVSLFPGHDQGENGRRVEQFLLDLDDRVTLLLRDAPPVAGGA